MISVKELMRHQKFVPDRLINWGEKSAADTFDIANLPEPKGDLILPVLALTEPGGGHEMVHVIPTSHYFLYVLLDPKASCVFISLLVPSLCTWSDVVL